MAAGNAGDLVFGRVHVGEVNRNKVPVIYDFAFGDFLAQRTFFDELSRVQTSLINDGAVKLNTGQEAKLDSTGGLLAIQIYMETLESTKEAMSGLSKLGLKNENKLWSSL